MDKTIANDIANGLNSVNAFMRTPISRSTRTCVVFLSLSQAIATASDKHHTVVFFANERDETPPYAGVAAVAVGIIEEWPRMRPHEPLPIDCVF